MSDANEKRWIARCSCGYGWQVCDEKNPDGKGCVNDGDALLYLGGHEVGVKTSGNARGPRFYVEDIPGLMLRMGHQ